ncbi:MAG: hypothetical protein ACMXYG_06485 [Candidatus Woesearchaeota archaeon]
MKKLKKNLTLSEEFEIMKLVLDKFLWIATVIMIYGVYKVVEQGDFVSSIYYFITGIVVLLLFMILIIKEYEVVRK